MYVHARSLADCGASVKGREQGLALIFQVEQKSRGPVAVGCRVVDTLQMVYENLQPASFHVEEEQELEEGWCASRLQQHWLMSQEAERERSVQGGDERLAFVAEQYMLVVQELHDKMLDMQSTTDLVSGW